MKQIARITILYSLFAAIATIANLGTQVIVIWIYQGPFAVEISILIGTLTGLPIKYVLEKRHIFEFKSDNLMHDSKLFLLYSFMGVFTTALFWIVEYGFHWAFGTDFMRYLGGAIGLTLGYIIKYRLDKRFVFVNRSQDTVEYS
ncbi:GtrA family protein [Sedimenticola selenatireducens]|uniref:GtrA family protein n=1 Tax=Sedimenticola selenatireducens TaxID=191960 RepID=A0A557S4Y7_9GAMM|nr:GtrA family protein [Sedimenticola selenatireducens]TVO72407.1 GtrA family protein [Sedimenticola selenatireducens]TVT64662.1 MAG: GtrA family protein [Sedimenticola selenatireducens]